MEKFDQDALSAYYNARKSLGKTHTFWMGKVDVPNNTVTWKEYDHRKTDGLGAFISTLKDMGIHNIDYPSIKNPTPPNTGKKQKIIERAIKRKKQWKVDWKKRKPRTHNNHAIKWRVIDENTSQNILHTAKKNQVSLNSYLLFTLNKVIGRHLTKPESSYFWAMPVNMRGAVELPNPSQNHFSFISIEAFAASGPQEIHREIKDQFRAQEHWAFWDIFRFMASSPEILNQTVGSASDDTRIGTFSNLGQWNINQLTPKDTFIFVPSITSDSPIAIGVTHINNKIGLAMHIDPSLGITNEQSDLLMNTWSETLHPRSSNA
ncbi:MAG: hypothetical protein K6L81_04445 [Agarilytica sp.]